MLNCWRVHEYRIVDMTELLIQKLSAFVTKSLLELGDDECDNLNLWILKLTGFKIKFVKKIANFTEF